MKTKYISVLKIPAPYYSSLSIGCLLWLMVACQPGPKNFSVKDYSQMIKDTSIILWNNKSDPKFNDWINNFLKENPRTHATYCTSCDGNLVELTGADVFTNGVGQLASGGSGTGGTIKPSDGGAAIGYWSLNFKLNIDDNIPKEGYQKPDYKKTEVKPYEHATPVIVAVLDTGVDSAYLANMNMMYDNASASCVGPEGNNGWNFVNNNRYTNDDFNPPNGHGSTVSRLLMDQVQAYSKSPVKILPVKVLPGSGPGYLFHLLCGIAYSKERGAQIINTSLGFYTKMGDHDAVMLLEEFVKAYLEEKKILLVTASGNQDPSKDLRQTPFYPASLMEKGPSYIIPVTTVSAGQFSRRQNYSKKLVLAGALSEHVSGSDMMFGNPRTNYSTPVQGSSYATPIVAGTLAAFYKELWENTPGGFVNLPILEKLKADGIIHENTTPDVQSGVRGGLVFKNVHL